MPAIPAQWPRQQVEKSLAVVNVDRFPTWVRVWLWGPLALVRYLAPLLLSQVLQMATLAVLPFSKSTFRWINTRIAGGIWGYWGWAIQAVEGTRISVEGDDLPSEEDAIVLCNHQEMGDVVLLMALALRHRRVGHLKWLVKDIVKYIPGVGWGMLFLDCVFLKRNWLRDASTIRRVFSRISTNKLPVWLISFPEGTRATPSKRAAGIQRDVGQGLEPFRHLLRPKHKGFAAAVGALRDHVKAVYSVTAFYHGGVVPLTGLIRGDCRHITLHVRRVAIGDLPEDETGLKTWILDDFRQKDQMITDWLDAEHASP